MIRKILVGGTLMLIGLATIAGQSAAEVKSAAPGKFKIEQELILPATPNEVFDAVTGDITPWWDHSFSAHPKKLYIEARPGGGFYEIFDDAGNGVQHAVVIYADRGKMLRFTGPLGLSGRAVDCVTTYQLTAVEGGTRFHLTVSASGEVDEAAANIVDAVWHHFLDERFKPYIESGAYKKANGTVEDQRHDNDPLMRGKVKTAKTITLEKTVNASPDEVFAWWTTDVGIRRIMGVGTGSRIEPHVGGAYTIIFDPAEDPEGKSYGTSGARILKFERPFKFAFEWIPFTDGTIPGSAGPPAAPASVRNSKPLPTWVELEFAGVPGDTMKTHVILNHYGFKSGGKWDEAYAFYVKEWARVMDKLAEVAEEQRIARSSVGGGTYFPGVIIHDNVPLSDFAWLAGRWVGVAGQSKTEQLCMAPSRGMMMCMFRVLDSQKVEGPEFSTLRETPNGLEERIRFYSPDLGETPGDGGVTLQVARYGDREIVFDNEKPEGVVKHVTITRTGKDEFSTRIEVLDAEGKSSFIGAMWKRVK